jgi:hypothetical protein
MSLAFDNEPCLVLVIELMAEDLLSFESIIFRDFMTLLYADGG